MRTEEITCPDGTTFRFTGHVLETSPCQFGVVLNGKSSTAVHNAITRYLLAHGFTKDNSPAWLASWLELDNSGW